MAIFDKNINTMKALSKLKKNLNSRKKLIFPALPKTTNGRKVHRKKPDINARTPSGVALLAHNSSNKINRE